MRSRSGQPVDQPTVFGARATRLLFGSRRCNTGALGRGDRHARAAEARWQSTHEPAAAAAETSTAPPASIKQQKTKYTPSCVRSRLRLARCLM